MADVDFLNFLRGVLKDYFMRFGEQVIRSRFGDELYLRGSGGIRSQNKIEAFMSNLESEVEKIVDLYIARLKEGGLTTARSVLDNQKTIDDITKVLEMELKSRL